MMLGLWPYVAAVEEIVNECDILTFCADCIVKRYDGPTLAAIVDGPTELMPDNLSVILGDSERLLDLDAPRYMSRYGETIPARKCDACGEDLTETAPPDELPF